MLCACQAMLMNWQHRQHAKKRPDRRLWHSQHLLRAGTSRTRQCIAQQAGATACWWPASDLSFQIDASTVADAMAAMQRVQRAPQPHELIIDAFAPAPANVCAICCPCHFRTAWSMEKPLGFVHTATNRGRAACTKFTRLARRRRVRPCEGQQNASGAISALSNFLSRFCLTTACN